MVLGGPKSPKCSKISFFCVLMSSVNICHHYWKEPKNYFKQLDWTPGAPSNKLITMVEVKMRFLGGQMSPKLSKLVFIGVFCHPSIYATIIRGSPKFISSNLIGPKEYPQKFFSLWSKYKCDFGGPKVPQMVNNQVSLRFNVIFQYMPPLLDAAQKLF